MPEPRPRLSTRLRLAAIPVAITALSLALLTPGNPAGASAPVNTGHQTNSPQVPGWGAGWLARQISANGGYLTGFGVPDATDTAYAVIGLHAAGVGRQASDQAIGYLQTQLGDALVGSDGMDSPGALAYYIMAAVSAGRDPRHFGGQAAQNDLVNRLIATQRTSGTDLGLFGSADPAFDGSYRQGLSLAALRAARVPATSSTVSSAVAWLRGQQCASGLWQSYRSSVSTPCPAADPATFSGPDTNSTSLAVQGLASYGQYPMRAQLLESLHAVQNSDGGFGYLATTGQVSDPDSTALSIQTILAEGSSPLDRRWQASGGNPDLALASFQLGCSAGPADRGAFFYPGSTDPNVLASVQAVPAAAHRTLPLTASVPSNAVPIQQCTASLSGRAGLSDRAGLSGRAGAVGRAGIGVSGRLADRQALTLAAKAPLTGSAGPCSGTSGVTVTVDFTAFSGVEQTRCASGAQSSGLTALQNAGFTPAGTTHYGLAFICRINGLPTAAQDPCVNTPPANAYWAYYHALAGATSWSFSSSGASSYQPPLGSIDAWAFGNSATPTKTPAQVRSGT